MKRIAPPMVGDVSSTVLTLVVIPAIHSLWKERAVRAAARGSRAAPVGSREARPTAASAVPTASRETVAP